MSLKNIKRYIDAQPTAYDIDKVIEQFKECSFRDPYGYGDDLIDIGYAIEIVKKGGAEWKIDSPAYMATYAVEYIN